MLNARSAQGGRQGDSTGEANLQAAPPAICLAELRERAHATGSAAEPFICARVHGHIQTLLGGLVFRDEEGMPTSEYLLELTVADNFGDEADATVSSALLHSLLGALPGCQGQVMTAMKFEASISCLAAYSLEVILCASHQ